MASGDETKSWLRGRLDWIALAGVAVAGWLVVLVVNRWHIGAPVVFLCLGWLAVLLCGRTLWGSAQAAAGEGTGPDEAGFELSAGRVAELEKEKRALLKAIKEVEFDREMGKMSEQDAAEISRVYRARAIDILKELEGDDGAVTARNAPLSRVIESEVRARLALAGVATRAKDKAQARAAKSETAPTAPGAAAAGAPGRAAAPDGAAATSKAGAAGAPGATAPDEAAAPSKAGAAGEPGAAGAPGAAGGASASFGASGSFGASDESTDEGSSAAGGSSGADEAPRTDALGAGEAAAGVAGADAAAVGAGSSASAGPGGPSPKKKKTKSKAKSPRASDGSGGVAGSGSGGAGGAAMQKREDA